MATAKQKQGLLRLLMEFFAIFSVVAMVGVAGHFFVSSQGYEPVPALLKLQRPISAVSEVIIPMACGIILTRIIVRWRKLSHVVWREPEYVPPARGGKAPTYAPPFDTSDDLLVGSALSLEPEPLYDLHLQPRISRLWWLMGSLASLGATIIIVYGLAHADVSIGGAAIGMMGAFCWAFAQEYLLRGLIVAEMRRLARRDRWALHASLLLSIVWMVPLAVTAATPTTMLVIILLGPALGLLSFALRRMFTTLWAPIIAQFLFVTAFFVLA